jgi:UDP-glucose 4-epimerase
MAASILVTGGAGYIGSHTCKALRQAGFAPVASTWRQDGRRTFKRAQAATSG